MKTRRPPEDLKGKVTNPMGEPLGKRIYGLCEPGWLVVKGSRAIVEKRRR